VLLAIPRLEKGCARGHSGPTKGMFSSQNLEGAQKNHVSAGLEGMA